MIELIGNVFYGFIMTYFGIMLPGMVNMTALRTSILSGRKAGIRFALGAGIMIAFHAMLAIVFTNYLMDHSEILGWLKRIGLVIFFILAVFFYSRGVVNEDQIGKAKVGRPVLQGMGIASINIIVIPIFIGLTLLLKNNFHVSIHFPPAIGLIIGVWLGASCLFSSYALLAEKLIVWIRPIARNINYLLSALMVFFFILLTIRVIYS